MSLELLTLPTTGSVLMKSSNPELRRVRVLENEDSIVLKGTVSCYYLKQLAQESVKAAADGRRVVNQIEVRR
jgi:hypothetical protein